MNRSFMLKITENPKFLENLNKSFYVQHRNKKTKSHSINIKPTTTYSKVKQKLSSKNHDIKLLIPSSLNYKNIFVTTFFS